MAFDTDETPYFEHGYVLSGFRHAAGLVATDARNSPEDIFTFLQMTATKREHQGHELDLLLEEFLKLLSVCNVCPLIEEYRHQSQRS